MTDGEIYAEASRRADPEGYDKMWREVTGILDSYLTEQRPPDKPCPMCAKAIPPMMPPIPMDWPGADEYDHYWCEDCVESFEMDDFNKGIW